MKPIEENELRSAFDDLVRMELAMKRILDNSWYGMLAAPLDTSASIVPRSMQKTDYNKLIVISMSNPPDTNVTLDGVCHWIFIHSTGRHYYAIDAMANLYGTMWRDPPIVVIKTTPSNWNLIKEVRLPIRTYNHYVFGMYGKEIYDNESAEKRRSFNEKIKRSGRSKKQYRKGHR